MPDPPEVARLEANDEIWPVSCLVFCAFEVGALPYKIAEALNRHGVKTYYVSVAPKPGGHDSTTFHFGDQQADWDLTDTLSDSLDSEEDTVRLLSQIREKYGITSGFATGQTAYLLKMAGIPYRYWSFGSDLDEYCFLPHNLWNWSLRRDYHKLRRFYREVRKPTRKSFRDAEAVMIAPYQAKLLSRVSRRKKLFFLPHVLTTSPDYDLLLREKAEARERICKKIGAKEFFFAAARHVWAEDHKDWMDNKGNDRMIHAFARYLELRGDSGAKLVLVSKGPDVAASKSLASDLGLAEQVVWAEEMRRKDLDDYYRGARACFGQLGNPVVTYCALEPLANGSPCVSIFHPNTSHVPVYEDMPPLLNVVEPDEVARTLCRLSEDDDYHADICHRSWLWTKNNCSEEQFVRSFAGLFSGAPSSPQP